MVLSLKSSRNFRPLLFGMPRLASTFSHTALFVLTFPLVVLRSVGPESKGLHLGLVSGSAAVISILFVLAAGIYADHDSGNGKHKLRVIGSLCLSLPPLVIIALGQRYLFIAAALIVVFLSRILTDAALLTLLIDGDDLAPKENYSAALTFQHFLGSTLGAIAFGLFPLTIPFWGRPLFFPTAAVAFVISVLGIFGFWIATPTDPDKKRTPSHPPQKLNLSYDFKNFLGARICFLTAMMVVPIFLVFIVRDLMAAENVRQSAATLMICALIGGLIFSGFSGRIVQQLGEVRMLFRSGWTIALTAPVFIFGAPYSTLLAMGCMVVFGAGFGAVMAAGTSLSVKLASGVGQAGRLMALITASTFISQLLASALGGLLLDSLNRLGHFWGYRALLVMVALFFVLGAWFLNKIRIDNP